MYVHTKNHNALDNQLKSLPNPEAKYKNCKLEPCPNNSGNVKQKRLKDRDRWMSESNKVFEEYRDGSFWSICSIRRPRKMLKKMENIWDKFIA